MQATSYDFSSQDTGYTDYGGDYGGGSYDSFAPVILNLDGNGIQVTPLSSSNSYYDMAGDGRQHRTAWAAAGNAVLVYDTNGDGQITQKNQVVFTEWDPTASSDLQAIQDVFDTNHNGKLDAGDAAFAKFKLLVTNADGTTTLKTLAQAGITSLNLIPDSSKIVLPDGSTIDGQAAYTRTDGSTGVAAAVSLTSDAFGYILKQTITHNGDRVVDRVQPIPSTGRRAAIRSLGDTKRPRSSPLVIARRARATRPAEHGGMASRPSTPRIFCCG